MVGRRLNKGGKRVLASLVVLAAALTLVDARPAVAQAGANLSSIIAANRDRRLDAADEAASVDQEGPGVISDPVDRRELPPPGGPTVFVTSITFTPASEFLSEAELAAIKADYVGRDIDFRGISKLVRDVNDLYAEKGVVTAAAVLPPQDLEGGKVVVNLVEGQVGVVAFVGERQTGTDFITNRVTFARGTTVDVPTASKDIAYFNRTNRAQLRLLLEPGASFGLTNLVFGVTEPEPAQFQTFIDNHGIESTGELRASHLYRRYGLFGVDDTLLVYVETSRGSQSGTVRFDLPVTPSGTRLAFNASASQYEVVAGPTVGLDLTGNAVSGSITLTQPIIANDRYLLQATASAFQGISRSYSAGVGVVDSDTVKFAPGLSFGVFGDNWTISSQAQAVYAEVTDKLAGTRTDYVIGTASVDGAYRFKNGLSLIGRGSAQYTDAQLLPGNLLFQIGGPSTVRGYPAAGVAGDSAYFVNLELHKRYDVRDTPIDGFMFTDFGSVYSTFPSVTTLASAGVGASVKIFENSQLDVVAAVPLKQSMANQSDLTVSAVLTLTAF